MERSIPFFQGPDDTLRNGFISQEYSQIHSNSIETLQKQLKQHEWKNKLEDIRKMYGRHMAMRIASEKALFSQQNRLPGLINSKIHLETSLGQECSLGFEDYIGDPLLKPFKPKTTLRTMLEVNGR